jgi:type IV fimbrial biogenesis protein FimT
MPPHSRGFSLTELAITLAITGIAAALALPSFTQLRRQSESRSASHLLSVSLATARLAAVSLNQPVAVCAATDNGACRSDGIWDEGWLVYRDDARKGQPATPAAVLQHVGPGQLGPGLRVRSSVHRSQARFLPDGRSSGSNLSILVCPSDTRIQALRVIVSNSGRVRSERLPVTPPPPECAPQA